MRYSLAGKMYCSDLPLARCGLINEECNSEADEAIQDTIVTENIYKHAFDMVAHNMRGYKYAPFLLLSSSTLTLGAVAMFQIV